MWPFYADHTSEYYSFLSIDSRTKQQVSYWYLWLPQMRRHVFWLRHISRHSMAQWFLVRRKNKFLPFDSILRSYGYSNTAYQVKGLGMPLPEPSRHLIKDQQWQNKRSFVFHHMTGSHNDSARYPLKMIQLSVSPLHSRSLLGSSPLEHGWKLTKSDMKTFSARTCDIQLAPSIPISLSLKSSISRLVLTCERRF